MYALLFHPHFNHSSTPPNRGCTNFINVFIYGIIFLFSVCGRFLSRILQISFTFQLIKFQKHISIRNYLPHFSLRKISVWLRGKIHAPVFLPHFNNSSTIILLFAYSSFEIEIKLSSTLPKIAIQAIMRGVWAVY